MAVETITAGVTLTLKETATSGSGTRTDEFTRSARTAFTIGTGAGAASKQYHELRILAGASETLDLTGGISNGLGVAITLAKVKVFYVRNLSTTNTITLGGGSNAIASIFGTTLVLRPGAEVLLKATDANGWAVTAGTGDQLQVAGTAGQSYEIAIAGE